MSEMTQRAAEIIRECLKSSDGRVALTTAFAAMSACSALLNIEGLRGDERVIKVMHDAAELLDPTCSRCNPDKAGGSDG